jgi:hypothetical protein
LDLDWDLDLDLKLDLHLDLDVDLHLDWDSGFGFGFHVEFTNSKTMTLTSERYSNGLLSDLDRGFGFGFGSMCSKTLFLLLFLNTVDPKHLYLQCWLRKSSGQKQNGASVLVPRGATVFWLRKGSGRKQNGASILVPRGANCGCFGVVTLLTPLEPYSEDSLLGKYRKC